MIICQHSNSRYNDDYAITIDVFKFYDEHIASSCVGCVFHGLVPCINCGLKSGELWISIVELED